MTQDSTPSLDKHNRHFTVWILTGLLVLCSISGFIRFWNLNGPELWEDEVYTLVSSQDLITKHLKWQGVRSEPHPPLIYLEAKIARRILGNTDAALRAPAAIWGVITVIAAYLVIGKAIGWHSGFITGLLLAIHPFAIEWSRDARMYSQWLAVTMIAVGLCIYAVQRVRNEQSNWADGTWWFLGLMFTLIHLYAMIGVSTIAAICIWLTMMATIAGKSNPWHGAKILTGITIAVVSYMTSWALVGIADILMRMGTQPSRPELDNLAALSGATVQAAVALSGYTVAPLAAFLWLIAFAGCIILLKRDYKLPLLVVFIAIMAFALFRSVGSKQFYADRYVTVCLLLFVLGLGYAISWASLQLGRWYRHATWLVPTTAFVLLGIAWFPASREILLKPRVEMANSFSPIIHQAAPNDYFLAFPEWMIEMKARYPFDEFVRTVEPPAHTMVVKRPPAGAAKLASYFDKTYAEMIDVLAKMRESSQPMPDTWILFTNPGNVAGLVDKLDDLLQVYDIEATALISVVQDSVSRETKTILVRLSQSKKMSIFTASGRQLRY